jgi:hypothetical protein
MYTYIMTRTQIYLSDDEAAVLEREARASGRTKSQLIREAIDQVYLRGPDATGLLRALQKSAGGWRRRAGGAETVERLRPGRLAGLHSRRSA